MIDQDAYRESMLELCRAEGKFPALPPDRPKHQWSDGLTETERKVLIWHQDKGWPIAKIATKAGVSQEKAQAIIEERETAMREAFK